ncbi:hypothetical protein [Mycobacterium angelicum]|uniref:Lipoprotein n=1 Tax=Mycobacterium angelicum TaxID=470074 RepID=A0A1W9ZEL1_MYCAN|nr:hypothetical protein [Mycobacterium angelicum]MCV7195170.1 hypothetical protein [Mycobacterium angelicum]ORA13476.1 hypothetical protein BST12_23940 [Mycobacterium angelicum]
MRSLATAPLAARSAAAALLVVGWFASAGVAGADPTTGPAPGPAPTTAPGPAPKTSIDHDGTYAVGSEIAPGTYSTAGPVGKGTCYWKRVAPDGTLIDNAISKKPQTVQIDPGDKAFKTSGCQPWQAGPPPDGNAPADLPGPAAGAQLQANLGILNGLLGQVGQQVPQS